MVWALLQLGVAGEGRCRGRGADDPHAVTMLDGHEPIDALEVDHHRRFVATGSHLGDEVGGAGEDPRTRVVGQHRGRLVHRGWGGVLHPALPCL